MPIIINGKFLSAPQTGVHRVAGELANALADILAEQPSHPLLGGSEVWIPRTGQQRSGAMRLPVRLLPRLTSIPWEQITLPLRTRRGVLLNLCNIGPVLSQYAVTMIHDAQVHIAPASYGFGFRMWYKLVQPILCRRHRHILTVSEFSRRQLIDLDMVSPDRISVVHNGVDHIEQVPAKPDIVPRLGIGDAPYVLALSTTQDHKNIRVLLDAFSDPAMAHVRLVLIGATPREAFDASGWPLPDGVVFAGRVDDGELRGLIEEALCLAFPSRTEGFGLPPLEAMLLGCPAIVSPCGALPEVCGDAALYASPNDPSEWRNAILSLIDQPGLRARYAEAGKAHARQFTWKAAAQKLIKILEAIDRK